MARIELPEVAEIVEAVRSGVERRLGKKRKIFTAEDLIEDVGLTPDQFEELLAELETHFAVEIEPETADQLTVAGALVIRLLRLCSREADGEDADAAVA